MENLIEQQVAKNKRLISEGRYEGAAMAMVGGLFYLILVAAVMKWLNL